MPPSPQIADGLRAVLATLYTMPSSFLIPDEKRGSVDIEHNGETIKLTRGGISKTHPTNILFFIKWVNNTQMRFDIWVLNPPKDGAEAVRKGLILGLTYLIDTPNNGVFSRQVDVSNLE
ncbi:hypothetical protein C8Q79DRAFT_1015103 [Trametes meyenii]|nr:hypothetical protein C8Q79DRAFT_1015103 [Trametes meyenii]